LHALEYHLGDGPLDLGSDGALFRMFLNPNHSMRCVVSNQTVDPVDHELSRTGIPNTLPRGGDSFLLCRKSFGKLAYLLYSPGFARTIYMKRLSRHHSIVSISQACLRNRRATCRR
jgi:hypothetical protein